MLSNNSTNFLDFQDKTCRRAYKQGRRLINSGKNFFFQKYHLVFLQRFLNKLDAEDQWQVGGGFKSPKRGEKTSKRAATPSFRGHLSDKKAKKENKSKVQLGSTVNPLPKKILTEGARILPNFFSFIFRSKIIKW